MTPIIEAKRALIADCAIAKDALNKALALTIDLTDDTQNKVSLADQINTHLKSAHDHTSRAVANSTLLQMRSQPKAAPAQAEEFVTVQK